MKMDDILAKVASLMGMQSAGSAARPRKAARRARGRVEMLSPWQVMTRLGALSSPCSHSWSASDLVQSSVNRHAARRAVAGLRVFPAPGLRAATNQMVPELVRSQRDHNHHHHQEGGGSGRRRHCSAGVVASERLPIFRHSPKKANDTRQATSRPSRAWGIGASSFHQRSWAVIIVDCCSRQMIGAALIIGGVQAGALVGPSAAGHCQAPRPALAKLNPPNPNWQEQGCERLGGNYRHSPERYFLRTRPASSCSVCCI